MTTIHAYTRTRVGIFANPEAGLSPRAIKGLLDSVKFFLVAFEGGMWRHDAPPYLAGGSTIDELSQPPVPVIICDGSADRSRLD